MKDVPQMITSKDLDYIKDMFNWNFVAIKKYQEYLEYVTEEDIKKELNKLIKLHTDNCNDLVILLETED